MEKCNVQTVTTSETDEQILVLSSLLWLQKHSVKGNKGYH